MTLFLIVWFSIGLGVWLRQFVEFFNHPKIRPGLVELIILMLGAPFFLLSYLFDKHFK